MATHFHRVLLVTVLVLLTGLGLHAQTPSPSSMAIPYIEGMEKMTLQGLDIALETKGTKFQINCINWPESYPYAPDVCGSMAYSDYGIAVIYHVRGMDLRAQILEDNGAVCQDSCCEFFVLSQDGKGYFNFEVNCVGTLHAAFGESVNDRTILSPTQMSRIKRLSSLSPGDYDVKDKIVGYTIALVIPFDLMGLSKDNLPESIKANLYKCADKSNHPHYISWSPVGTPKPNFHQPGYFGEIRFNSKNN